MTAIGGKRLVGVDVARGLAMFAMVVTHYVWPDSANPPDVGLGADLVRIFDGRAMPLFVMLGGVGLSFLARRPAGIDRSLVLRAVLLFGLGMILNLATDTIAVVLQFYGLLFVLGPVWRRLPNWALLAAAAVTTMVGGWSFQVAGEPRQQTTWRALSDGGDAIASLFVTGYYPFFPVFAFFSVGVVIGRLQLAQRSVAVALTIGGAAVGFGSMLIANIARAAADSSLSDSPLSDSPLAAEGSFSWVRLLDWSGHSEMPAWVISSTGTSAMVIGLCLVIANLFPTLELALRPVATLGTMSLSFYALQIVTSRYFPSPLFTSLEREWVNVAVLYVGFAVFALGWHRWIGTGPLESLLRLGSKPGGWSRRASPIS